MLPFIMTCLAVLLTPGPTNTILAASGAVMGVRSAVLLPLAEAAGYTLAVSVFLAASGLLSGVPAALSIMKAIAAAWLLISAWRLWYQQVVPEIPVRARAFRRVLLTTVLNPKAMLVGTIIIPEMMATSQVKAVLVFMSFSVIAGAGWVALGAALPKAVRPYSYKAAAVVVLGFSIAAAASVARF